MHKKTFVVLYGLIALVCCWVAFSSGYTISSLEKVGYCSSIILFAYLYIDFIIVNLELYNKIANKIKTVGVNNFFISSPFLF